MGLPLILPMAILTILKCRTIDYSIRVDVKTGITLAAMAVDDNPNAVQFGCCVHCMDNANEYFREIFLGCGCDHFKIVQVRKNGLALTA